MRPCSEVKQVLLSPVSAGISGKSGSLLLFLHISKKKKKVVIHCCVQGQKSYFLSITFAMTACLSNATVRKWCWTCGFVGTDAEHPALLECHFLARNNKAEDTTFSRIFGIS